MENKKRIYYIMYIVFIVDQFIKLLVVGSMRLYQKIVIIPNFFSILYVRNTGAAFSILEDNTLFLIAISVLKRSILSKKNVNTLNYSIPLTKNTFFIIIIFILFLFC